MSEKIDINVADAETLATISGIGSALAERIIEYRQTVHPFEEVIELAAVPGISEKMVRGFEDLVMVGPVSRVTAVPLQVVEPEEIPLLAAPDELELLPAEVASTTTVETPQTTDEAVVIAEPEPTEDASSEEETEGLAVDMAANSEPEELPEDVQTAVSPLPAPEIEDLSLAEPDGAVMPEPDLVQAAPPAQN